MEKDGIGRTKSNTGSLSHDQRKMTHIAKVNKLQCLRINLVVAKANFYFIHVLSGVGSK